MPNTVHNATFQGLHDWHKHKFEMLGWMVLAHNSGNTLKVESYKQSVNDLHVALEAKITSTKCPDRKADLAILLENVKVLQAHIAIDFSQKVVAQQGGARKGSRKSSKKGSRTRK